MLVNTAKGLYCPMGNFYVDPSRAVENAIVTHAHSDHARRGSKNYFTPHCGIAVLKARLGNNIHVIGKNYGETFSLGGIKISFHPAGHILGSAQVRLDNGREVWVASGDYKREADPTCAAFEPVCCDVFVTEATFGTPAYRWPKNTDVGREIHEWRETNAAHGMNSILFAYSLGKAQRVLASLLPFSNKPVFCHSAVYEMSETYRSEGVNLVPLRCLDDMCSDIEGELILAPQSFLKTKVGEKIASRPHQTAFASGWMAGSEYGYDRGFVMSDHADWDDLLLTIKESQAKTVYVMHRGSGALVRHLRGLGIKAFPVSKLDQEISDQTALF